MVPADDATDNLVARQPGARALLGDALFSATQLASKQPTAYAAREAQAGNVRVQASERVGRKQEIGVQVNEKSLPLSLKANPPQHLERYVKRRRRTPSAWKRYYFDRGTPCPPDCPACILADKHYGTPFRFRLTLTFALGMASEVDRFLLALSPPAFYLCHFEESRGDGQYHCHILIGGIYRPWLRARVRRWPWRTMLETLYDHLGRDPLHVHRRLRSSLVSELP